MTEHASPPPPAHNSRPYVTVVIPVYNTEKYLREALDSVLMQSLKNIEILCINDGSTDSSQQILEEYAHKDSRIKIIVNEENKGIGQVRNLGIDNASAKYTATLSSDDYYFSKNTLKKYYSVISKSDNIFSVKTKKTIIETPQGEFKVRKGIYPPRMFNNDLIKKHNIRYIEGYTYEDWFFEQETFLCKFLNGYKNVIIGGKWWIYRRREDKSSITEIPENRLDQIKGYRILERKIRREQGTDQLRILRIISSFYFRLSHHDLDNLVEWQKLVKDWKVYRLLKILERDHRFTKQQKYYFGYYLRVCRHIQHKRVARACKMLEKMNVHVNKIQRKINI